MNFQDIFESILPKLFIKHSRCALITNGALSDFQYCLSSNILFSLEGIIEETLQESLFLHAFL